MAMVRRRLLANYLLCGSYFRPEAPVTVPYTLFKEEVGKGNVEAIYSQGESITGRFKAGHYPPRRKKAAPSGKSQTADEKKSPHSAKPKVVSAIRWRSARRAQDW